ncbi:hypothetical protein [Streptosporangium sp. NPDC006007]|uniref:hypothetical protein n=1 Tax=Streptosporangium sp. NPDC006007 TaxID=3154575 RepID=UPI0033AC8324
MQLPDWFTKPESLFAFTSALAAWVAMIFAWSSAHSARKQLKLLRKQEERKGAPLLGRINESYYKIKDNSYRYMFALYIINPSETENSLTRAELWVSYSKTDGSSHVAKILNDKKVDYGESVPDEEIISVPATIGIRDAIYGKIFFSFPEDFLKGCSIQKHTIVLEDGIGATSEIPSIIIDAVEDHGE